MRRLILVLILLAAFGVAGWYGWRWWHARPTPTTVPVPTFFVVSDNHGARSVYRELLAAAKAQGAEFVVHLGDMVEDGTAEEFAAVVAMEAEVGLPVYHVPGNHDIAAAKDGTIFAQAVGPLSQTFDRGPARFILLNNADRKVGFSNEQLEQLETALTTAGDRYSLVFYHRPFGLPLEALFGDDETPTSRPTTEAFREIIKQLPPAMIFSGHVHTYLPYALEGVPAVVTGGGGDQAQRLLGGSSASFFHGLLVRLTPDGPETELVRPEATVSATTVH